jgi:TonB family protein
LPQRLGRELRFAGRQLRQTWPDLKRDPIGFIAQRCKVMRANLRRKLFAVNSLAATATPLLVMLTGAILLLVLSERMSGEGSAPVASSEGPAQIVEFLPEAQVKPERPGVGAGSRGRVGFNQDRGEGSAVQPRKSSGGGGGGNHNPLPAPQGHLPPPSPIPAPIPPFPPVHKQALAVAGIDIDPALWRNLPIAGYGDPRAKSTAPSSGPGSDGGMGNGNGTGIGEGSGPGVGPGQNGNIGGGRRDQGCCGPGGSNGNSPDDDPDRIYPGMQVTERARVLSKPEPQYTEDARRNQITGAVVLRVVFSRTGEVTNIRAIHPLPFGLTEKAIAAARMIRFRPATRAGRPVNVYMQLEYNFNLY